MQSQSKETVYRTKPLIQDYSATGRLDDGAACFLKSSVHQQPMIASAVTGTVEVANAEASGEADDPMENDDDWAEIS